MPQRLAQLSGIFHQRFPQRRLPLLRVSKPVNALVGLPAHQPLGAINQILVIEIRHSGGQLKQLALVAIVVQIVAQ